MKALKKTKTPKESKTLQPLFVVVDDSELEMLNKQNKMVAVFCDSSVYILDKCFDVENSHCDIFQKGTLHFFIIQTAFKVCHCFHVYSLCSLTTTFRE